MGIDGLEVRVGLLFFRRLLGKIVLIRGFLSRDL